MSGPDGRAAPRPVAAAGLPLVRGHFVVPMPPSDCLDRPRLRQVLDEAVTRPLTVVRAPAGWGKTTLLAGWAAARPAQPPFVWIRIDPAATPTVPGGPTVPLWPQLLHGLGRAGLIPAGADLAPPGAATAHHPPDRGYRQLANLLADLPAPFVLVMDDVHLLHGRSDLDGLELLVNEVGERVRTILVGRTTPVALHRLRAAGRVTEIGAGALAFTRSEAVDLLRAQGVSATAGLVGGLLHATEGWPAGLRLAAGALGRGAAARLGGALDAERAGGRTGGSSPWASSASVPQWAPVGGRVRAADPDPPSASLAATPEIVEFLRAELLARQPPAVHRFLLRTSVLESMTGPLADAVVGEADLTPAAQVLAEIAQRYGFVVAHHDGLRFRYHRLFAALLRSDLARDRTEDVDELHLRAALWFAAHRRPAEAVRHAAWAGDWWYASCLLVDGAGMVDALSGAALRLEPTLAAMPASWASWAPECALVAADGHLRHGRVAKATRCLEMARVAIAAAAISRRPALSTQADLVELRRAELVGAGEEMLGVARRLLRAGPDVGTSQRRRSGRRVSAPPRSDGPLRSDGPAAGPADRPADRPAEQDGLPSSARVEPTLIGGAGGWPDRPGAAWPPGSPGRDDDRLGEIVTALAWCGRGRAELWLGRAEPAVDALIEGVEAARLAGARLVEMSAAGALALAYALRGRLRLAESAAAVVFAAVGELSARPGEATLPSTTVGKDGATISAVSALVGWVDATEGDATVANPPGMAGAVEAHLAMAMVAIARADEERVVGHLQAARSGLGPGHPPHLLDLVVVLDARSRCRRGRPDDVRTARRLLSGRGRPAGPPLCLSLWQAVEVDLLLAVGNAQAARQALGRPVDGRRPDHVLALAAARADLGCADLDAAENAVAGLLRADGGGGGPVVAACALAAVAAARRDDHARATGLLARALVLAEDEGLAAPFLDLGDELLALLDAHPGLAAAHPEFVDSLRAAAAAAAAAPTASAGTWRAGPGDRSGGGVTAAGGVGPAGGVGLVGGASLVGGVGLASGGGAAGAATTLGGGEPAGGVGAAGGPAADGAGVVAGAELLPRPGVDQRRVALETGTRGSGVLVPAPARSVPPARPTAAGGRLPWPAPGGTPSGRAGAGHGGGGGFRHSGEYASPPGRGIPAAGSPKAPTAGGPPAVGLDSSHIRGGGSGSAGAPVDWRRRPPPPGASRPGVPGGPGGSGGSGSAANPARHSRRPGGAYPGPHPGAGGDAFGGVPRAGAADRWFREPDRRRPGGGPAAGDRLSDRELAVLSYLPTMLTTAEIAAELYVSVNTVKTHLKSIYRKLDVPRRRDAVHRARELHLL